MSSGQSELEKLEAKLRETEQRLAKVSRQNSPSRQTDTGASGDAAQTQRQAHPLSLQPAYPDDRPPTQPGQPRPTNNRGDTQELVSGMPGAMPGTPGQQANGRDDYVMVDKGRGR